MRGCEEPPGWTVARLSRTELTSTCLQNRVAFLVNSEALYRVFLKRRAPRRIHIEFDPNRGLRHTTATVAGPEARCLNSPPTVAATSYMATEYYG